MKRTGREALKGLAEDLRDHLERQTEENIARGMTPEDARRQAILALGNPTLIEEDTRAVWTLTWVENFAQDFGYALRFLRGSAAFTAVAVLSLALGIGANTAVFSLLDAVLLRSLPIRSPDRVVLLIQAANEEGSWTNPLWEQLRAHPDLFAGTAAWGVRRLNLAHGGESRLANGILISGRFFDVLGVTALVGRTFTADDDQRGGGSAGPVAVISYRFWQQYFGGDADVLGRPVWLDDRAFTVIGVTPPAFTGLDLGTAYDVAIPLGDEPVLSGDKGTLDARGYFWLNILARLKPGQSIAAASAAFRGIQPQMRAATLPGWRTADLKDYLREPFEVVPATSGPSFLRGRYEKPLIALMVIVALVLLIACANVASVLLARAAARRHEMGVRLALGASRGRLLRQLLTESAVLSIISATLGLLFAHWGSALLVRQISMQSRSVFLDLSPDGRVLTFTAAIAIATALLFGTAPALRASAVAPNRALKQDGRGTARDRRGVLHTLVIAQVAMSLVLLVGAGLFVRTFTALTRVPLGFDQDRVLVLALDARGSHTSADGREALFERIREAAAGVPGVAGASLSIVTPVSGSQWGMTIENPPGLSLPEDARDVRLNQISAGWFTTYGTALVAGRDFDAHDRVGAPPVAIVNQAFARKFFPSTTVLGRSIREVARPGQQTPALRIVGVVRDAVYASVRERPTPTLYYPLAQSEALGASMELSVRAAQGAPASLERTVGAAVSGVDSTVSFTEHLLSSQIEQSLAQQRIVAMLSAFFGGLALLLAGVGLYGVMAYTVSQRRREIAIRVALGASPASGVNRILIRVVVLLGLGIAAGSALSLWASRFVTSLLFGLPPHDPTTLAGSALILLAIGVAAAWLPARRAAHIDPAQVLRES